MLTIGTTVEITTPFTCIDSVEGAFRDTGGTVIDGKQHTDIGVGDLGVIAGTDCGFYQVRMITGGYRDIITDVNRDGCKVTLDRCECRNGCQCEASPGPAAFLVERDGRQLKVCTRCDFTMSADGDVLVGLLVSPNDDPQPYFKYDKLGYLMIGSRMPGTETPEA